MCEYIFYPRKERNQPSPPNQDQPPIPPNVPEMQITPPSQEQTVQSLEVSNKYGVLACDDDDERIDLHID